MIKLSQNKTVKMLVVMQMIKSLKQIIKEKIHSRRLSAFDNHYWFLRFQFK